MATSLPPPSRFNPQQVMFNQLTTGGRPLFTTLTPEAQTWYNTRRPGSADAMPAKFGATTILYGEVMRVLSETHARQKASLEIIDRIQEELRRVPADSNRAHQLETLLRYLIRSLDADTAVNAALQGIDPRRSQERKDGRGLGGSGETKSVGGGRKSKTRKASKKTGKKRKGGYKFTRAANSRRSLRMKTRKLKSLTQKSPKKKQKKKHGKKHGKKHDKKSKSRKARKGKHHKRGKRR